MIICEVETLKKHSKDKREYVYSRSQLEQAKWDGENGERRPVVDLPNLPNHGAMGMEWIMFCTFLY